MRRALSLSLFLLLAFPLPGQTKNLTLEQAKAIALERNLNVAEAQNNIQAAQARALAARGGYLPSISASGGWSRSQSTREGTTTQVINGFPVTSPAFFQVTNNFTAGLSAGYTLFDGFAREGNLGAATSLATVSELTAARTRQAIIFQVVTDYLNVLRNEYLVSVSAENLKRDLRQLERIVESNRVGALSMADVYRQKSQVAIDEVALITQQNNYDKSKADLVALIGLDVAVEYTFNDPLLPTGKDSLDAVIHAPIPGGIAEMTQKALTARADYMGAKENLSASESGVTAARSGYFPSASVFGGYSLLNDQLGTLSQNRNLNWGLQLRWTLFDGFQTNQQIQSAMASKRNAEITLAQTERNVGVDVKKAFLDLEASRKAYDASQEGLVSATEDRKIAEERYNLGAGTLLDLLTANANLVQAQANLANSTFGFLVSRYNLEYAIGERAY
jgi:outer membrane protein